LGNAQRLLRQQNIKVVNINLDELAVKLNSEYESESEKVNDARSINLSEVYSCFSASNIEIWLQGKTLLHMVNKGWFERDHDDDIGVDIQNLENICNIVVPALLKIGFVIIRVDPYDAMISVYKRNRYIDICFLRRNELDFYGYSRKYAPRVYYKGIRNISAKDGSIFPIPQGAEEICALKYGSMVNYMLTSFIIWDHGITYIDEIKSLVERQNGLHSILSISDYIIERDMINELAFQIYCKERITKHIWDKSMHLKRLARRAKDNTYRITVLKLISKKFENPICRDKKVYSMLKRELFNFKWEVRNSFNPLSTDSNKKLPYTDPGISHEHVIHGCDTTAELVQLDILLNQYRKGIVQY
tara:strand:+ start:555 stop:1631 length:1077 start_codon:yes stop_codon:yes gene_type:complete